MAGDRRALARVLTAVENRTAVGEAALRRLYRAAGRAHLVGITGPPGSGKSTLVAALIAEVRRAGRTVAVLAVDPSSPITGGALLGDRVRMQAYAGDDGVFIRSMAARGHAGGLASTSTAAAAVLDAAGFDLVLLETVGTGQSEVEVAATADTTVVLEAPEMGDEVQAIKAGLLEVADLVVVNKGDKPGAQRTAAQLRAMLVPSAPRALGEEGGPARGNPSRPRPKRPDVLITTALTGDGVPELLAALDRHRATGADSGAAAIARQARAERKSGRSWASGYGPWRLRPPAAWSWTSCSRRPRPTKSTRTRPRTDSSNYWLNVNEQPHRDASGRNDHAAFRAMFAAVPVFVPTGSIMLRVASRFAAGPLGADPTGVGVLDRGSGGGGMTIQRVFVAGAGLMGHGIAQVHASIGLGVVLYEPELATAESGLSENRGEPGPGGRQGPPGGQ